MAEGYVKWTLDDYKKAIAVMTRDETVINMTTNEQRIRHILEEVRPRNEFRAEMQFHITQCAIRTDKSFEVSEKFRYEGKQNCDQNDYQRALTFFSMAILNAPHVQNPDLGDDLYQAYRERSFAFYEVKDYEKSLYDINQALDICQTLEDYCHKINCLRFLRKYSEALEMIIELLSENFEFKSETDHQLLQDLQTLQPIIQFERQTIGDTQEIPVEDDLYLFVDDCVEIFESEDRGRYMMAKSDRPKGSVILIEKAQYYLIHNYFLHEFCGNCCKRIGQKFFPCVWCTERIFCDENCYKEAMVRFHRYQCGVTALLYRFSQHKHFALSILLSTGYRSGRELVQYVNNCFNSGNRFDVEKWIKKYNNTVLPNGRKSEELKREEFETFLTFVDHSESQPLEPELLNCFEAIEVLSFVDISQAFIIEDDQTFISLAALVIQLSRKVSYNAFSGSVDAEVNQPVGMSSVICLVATMCNHSCVPNVNWRVRNNIQEYKTNRPIRKGDEISDSYGPSTKNVLDERQRHLKENYNFTCGCVLCANELQGNLSLRCLACNGPVFGDGICLICLQPYLNYEENSGNAKQAIETFNTMANNIERNFDRRKSIKEALNIFEYLKKFIYLLNPEFQRIYQISSSYRM